MVTWVCGSVFSLAQVGISQLSKTVGTYIDSQWDCTQFTLPSEIPCLCTFTADTRSVIGREIIMTS